MPYLRLADFGAIFLALTLLLLKEGKEELGMNLYISDSPHGFIRHAYLVGMLAYTLLFGVLNGDQFIYFQF